VSAASVETSSSLLSTSGGGLWIAIRIRYELLNQYVQRWARDDDVTTAALVAVS